MLLRLGNLPTVWTNALAGTLLGGGNAGPGTWLLAAASLSCSYLGGMALNDLWDRGWDRRHRPARPIPAGQVGAAEAGVLATVLLLAGPALLLAAPGRESLPAELILLGCILAYDRWHKENPLAPLLMGLCRGLSYLVAALAVAGGAVTAVLLLAALLQTGYVLLLTLAARGRASGRGKWRLLPPVPWLLAGVSVLDGLVLAVALAEPAWLLPGIAGAVLTAAAQRWVPGD